MRHTLVPPAPTTHLTSCTILCRFKSTNTTHTQNQVGAGGVVQQSGGCFLLRARAQRALVDRCCRVNRHPRLLLLHGWHACLTLYRRFSSNDQGLLLGGCGRSGRQQGTCALRHIQQSRWVHSVFQENGCCMSRMAAASRVMPSASRPYTRKPSATCSPAPSCAAPAFACLLNDLQAPAASPPPALHLPPSQHVCPSTLRP